MLKKEEKGEEMEVVSSHEHLLERTKINDGWACDLCHQALSPAKRQWVCSVEECSYARCMECDELKDRLATAADVGEVKWSTKLKPVPSLLFTGTPMGTSITADHTPLSLFSMFVPLSLLTTMVDNTNICATRPPHKWKVQFISCSLILHSFTCYILPLHFALLTYTSYTDPFHVSMFHGAQQGKT
jgi:hypothetical protein